MSLFVEHMHLPTYMRENQGPLVVYVGSASDCFILLWIPVFILKEHGYWAAVNYYQARHCFILIKTKDAVLYGASYHSPM